MEITDEMLNNIAMECIKDPKKPFPEIGDWHTSNGIAFYGFEKMYDAYKNDKHLFKDIMRDNAKKTGLALCYGGSYKVVERAFGVTESEAKEKFNNFYKTLRGYKKHSDETLEKAKKNLYMRNLFGRVLYIPELGEKDYRIIASGIRNVKNYGIQSLAGDMIKLAMNASMKLINNCETDILCENNIHKEYYSRIVTANVSRAEELDSILKDFPKGNVLLCLVDDDNNIVSRYDRCLLITTDDIEKLKLSLEW